MNETGSSKEQESWNKRFEMSLAEIYMELPDGHRAKKDYEALIADPRGKMVEMSVMLKDIEAYVRDNNLFRRTTNEKITELSLRCDRIDEVARENFEYALSVNGRIDRIKEKIEPDGPVQPQPVATLCEAVEKLVARCQDMAANDLCECEPEGHICGIQDFRREINNVRLALAAERKRAVLVE